ncbi:MAG: hypothetical protein VYA34_00270 [Myxococcota bacterium]|nr:hypothetical protein [Myxococcota bacterium]
MNMQRHYQQYRPMLVAGDFSSANEFLDKSKKDFYSSEKNRLLYFLDKAVVLHLDQKFVESNTWLEAAKTASEELWTESVSEHAGALFTTDNALSYPGEDFERVLIHLIASLNYMGLGDLSAARVEARQVTNKLEAINVQYSEESKNAYRDDAFARWLSGKLASTEGTYAGYNDAWIDYRKSLKLFEEDYAARYKTVLPRLVVEDAFMALTKLGDDFSEERNALRAEYPYLSKQDPDQHRGLGEIIFLHLNGEAPYKIDQFWTAQSGGDIIRVAYPRFVEKRPTIWKARLNWQGGARSAETELFENITAIAIQNLQDHMGRIKAKAIARAIGKYVASKGVQALGKQSDSGGGNLLEAAGILMNWGSALAEEADKRSWITLPSRIDVGRVFLPPGEHVLEIDFLDSSNQPVISKAYTVNVVAGKTIFLWDRTFR